MSDSEIIKKVHSKQIQYNILNVGAGLGVFLDVFLVCATLFGLMIGMNVVVPLLIVTVVCIIATVAGTKGYKKVEKDLKNCIGEAIVRDILAERIDIVEYDPDSKINSKAISNSCIMPNYDKLEGSDYLKGTYRGHEFVFCDLHLQREETETDSDGDRHKKMKTVFQGHFLRIPLKNDLDGFVKMRERRSARRQKGFISDLMTQAAEAVGIKKETHTIEVENEAFNNKFEITTNNDELAFYILTPHFMENIVKIERQVGGYTNINFRYGVLYVSINNGEDAFEIKKALRSKKRLEKCREQMRKERDLILSILDEVIEKDQLFS